MDNFQFPTLKKPILSLETATPVCSVAIRMPDGTLWEERTTGTGLHSEALFVFIKKLLQKAGIQVAGLGGVMISGGPGSYTGLRVASSAVKGLIFQTDIPLYACHTLGAFAWGVWRNKDADLDEFATVMDARRKHLYFQKWIVKPKGIIPNGDVIVSQLDEVSKRIHDGLFVAGTGMERLTPGHEVAHKFLSQELIVSARNMLYAIETDDDDGHHEWITKVDPETFEPRYYAGL